ncbi:hypothetical protein [Alteromonas sp. RW2A1]|uniref:hypothetical protein n=1 Tax=Alteromonas sp. RW2A1 TaxID=1917158 RepID=UPI0012ECB372|nr:hypothetical protein [Alteromonas sp. RW2A1]
MTQQHHDFVDALGGHGFLRTVLFNDGVSIDSDNVEIISKEQLHALGEKFRSAL